MLLLLSLKVITLLEISKEITYSIFLELAGRGFLFVFFIIIYYFPLLSHVLGSFFSSFNYSMGEIGSLNCWIAISTELLVHVNYLPPVACLLTNQNILFRQSTAINLNENKDNHNTRQIIRDLCTAWKYHISRKIMFVLYSAEFSK